MPTLPSPLRTFRYVWAAPNTAVGLAVSWMALVRGRVTIVDGVVEAHGPLLAWMLARMTAGAGEVAALTLGHVVVGQNAATLAETRAHERVHVRQYEVWGPAFLPAYVASSLWARLRGRHFYYDNRFEVEARLETGELS